MLTWPLAAAFLPDHMLLAITRPDAVMLYASEGEWARNSAEFELAVLRVLSQAGKLQAKSVALPLLGAGRARWPTDTAAKLQVAAVLQYFHRSTDTSLRVSSHALR